MQHELANNGEIKADSLYRLDEIQRRLGVGRAAWRSMLRAGLPTKHIPGVRRKYVKGGDLITWIDHVQPSNN